MMIKLPIITIVVVWVIIIIYSVANCFLLGLERLEHRLEHISGMVVKLFLISIYSEWIVLAVVYIRSILRLLLIFS